VLDRSPLIAWIWKHNVTKLLAGGVVQSRSDALTTIVVINVDVEARQMTAMAFAEITEDGCPKPVFSIEYRNIEHFTKELPISLFVFLKISRPESIRVTAAGDPFPLDVTSVFEFNAAMIVCHV
jgi:hypothetical protein